MMHARRLGCSSCGSFGAQQGFTLAELLVVSLIAMTLGLVCFTVSQTAASVTETVNTQGALQMQLANGTGSVGQDLRLCTSLPTQAESVLTISIPSIDADGQIISGNTDTVRYAFDPSARLLRRTITLGAGSRRPSQARVVIRDLAGVTFTIIPGVAPARPLVQGQFQASRTTATRSFFLTLSRAWTLRNL